MKDWIQLLNISLLKFLATLFFILKNAFKWWEHAVKFNHDETEIQLFFGVLYVCCLSRMFLSNRNAQLLNTTQSVYTLIEICAKYLPTYFR